jgi:hypothetical protein
MIIPAKNAHATYCVAGFPYTAPDGTIYGVEEVAEGPLGGGNCRPIGLGAGEWIEGDTHAYPFWVEASPGPLAGSQNYLLWAGAAAVVAFLVIRR